MPFRCVTSIVAGDASRLVVLPAVSVSAIEFSVSENETSSSCGASVISTGTLTDDPAMFETLETVEPEHPARIATTRLAALASNLRHVLSTYMGLSCQSSCEAVRLSRRAFPHADYIVSAE